MTNQRGIALLAVMFALLLMSVIGLGMMFSTNTESTINYNYRDAQVVVYASKGGLYEVRDRIQPSTHNIDAPTALPSLTAANVIYVLASSSIVPWDTSDPYFDSELCQENVLGLSGTAGVPCTTMVASSNTAWRTIVNDSLSTSAPWNLSTPLDTKWVRITLKGNNMTPVAVNGNSGTSTQTCWDGANQVPLPSGYGATCAPNGSVGTIVLTAAGSGFTSTPAVTLSAPPSGTQATAHPVMTSVPTGHVASISITTGGSGYTSAPTVTITDTGAGTGATATATVPSGGAPVASVTWGSSGGQCYAAGTPPSASVSGGTGTGATATVSLASTKSCIYSWSISGVPPTCNSHKNDVMTVTPTEIGSGSSFSGTMTFNSSGVPSIGDGRATISNPGSSYTADLSATLSFSGGCSVPITAVAGYLASGITLGATGSGYTTPATVNFGTGTGSGVAAPSATATLGAAVGGSGTVTAITIVSSGNNYTAPTVSFSGGSGSGVVAVATVGVDNTLTSIAIDVAGSGYISDPTVTISGGGGTGATATARIGRGANYGKIYLLTSLAQTRSGARAMTQAEVASPVLGWNSTGALTLDGPNPSISSLPSSANFIVNGNDSNSCSETAEPTHPAVGTYDDPNANPPTTSTQSVTNTITAGNIESHYTGTGSTPSVQNVYDGLGDTLGTPTGLKALIDAVRDAPGAHVYGESPTSIELGSCGCATKSYTDPLGQVSNIPIYNSTNITAVTDYVDGDLTLDGNNEGYGILVVTGTLTMKGNFKWNGVVLVIGDGIANFSGGGAGKVNGTLLVSKIWTNHTTNRTLLSSVGSPTISWSGGGGNGIQYDHCWSTNLMQTLPFTPPPSTRPLKVLSIRSLPY